MSKIVLLRGLNTYGGDDMRLGFFHLGDFYLHWKNELKRRGHEPLPLMDIGPGTLRDSYHKVQTLLEEQINSGSIDRFHLLTHSSGGLLARKLSYEQSLKSHILSISTVASPHHGSSLISKAEEWSKKPFRRSLLKMLGYDLDGRIDHLRELSPEKMAEFNKFHPPLKSLPFLNLPCSLPPRQRAWLFSFLSPYLPAEERDSGDGLLPLSRQTWHESRSYGPLKLDHLSSLGFFLHLRPENRNLASREFQRAFDQLNSFWKSVERS